MGVNLTPIMVKKILSLNDLRGRSLAVDANNTLYQFLALIRTPDGTPLQDRSGNITSNLAGLMFRSTRLIQDYDISLMFVFDGTPPQLKEKEITKRQGQRAKATREYEKAIKSGDLVTAFSKAVMMSRLTRPIIDDSKRLLTLLGIPFVEAPSEAEAETAHMAMRGEVWAASSMDYDSLLFGSPRLVRYLTISGREFLPSKGIARPLKPELIDLNNLLSRYEISREQLIDISMLVGTDFNKGVKGIGPKTALELVKQYGKLENLPNEIRSKILGQKIEEARKIFLEPKVSENYSLRYGTLQEEELIHFLCGHRDFSEERVQTVIKRMKKFYARKKQTELEKWFG